MKTMPINMTSGQLPFVKHTRFVAGIDPDIERSGLAIWDRVTNTPVFFKALPIHQLQMTVLEYGPQDLTLYVEAGWLNQGFYSYYQPQLPDGFSTWSKKNQQAYMFQRGCDVGRNHGAGQVICHFFRANGYNVVEWKPQSGKWDAALLKRITGIATRTNQEVRDALKLAYLNR